jgi:hypothetical protein
MLANYETRRLEVYSSKCAMSTILQDPYIAAQFPVGAKLAFIHVPEWIKVRSSRKKSEGMCLLSDAIQNQWPYDIVFYMESVLNAFKQIFCAVWPDEDVKKHLMPAEFEHRLRMLQTNAERGMRGGASDVLLQMKTESTSAGRVACVNCNTLFVASGSDVLCFACAPLGTSVVKRMRDEYSSVSTEMREHMDVCATCLPEFTDAGAQDTRMYTADLTTRCTNVACSTFCKRAHAATLLPRIGTKLARLTDSGVRGELACTSRGRAGACGLDW